MAELFENEEPLQGTEEPASKLGKKGVKASLTVLNFPFTYSVYRNRENGDWCLLPLPNDARGGSPLPRKVREDF